MPNVTFGAVSLQLRSLVQAGLLQTRAESRNRFYRARRDTLGALGKMLEHMWDDKLWALKLEAWSHGYSAQLVMPCVGTHE